MRCSRCSGAMANEYFQDMRDDTGRLSFFGWRCLTCGEILDPVIMSNRKNKPAPLVSNNHRFAVSAIKR